MDGEENRNVTDAGAGNPGEEGGRNTPGADMADNDSLMSRLAAKDGTAGENNENSGADGKNDSPKNDADKGEGKGGKREDPAAQAPDKAEGYDLKFSPETRVDAELLGSFRQTALELGLTRAQAQKLAGLYEGHTAKAAERMRAEQTRALLEARKGWEDEITGTPTFQEDQARIQSALRRFGDAELYELLDQTNLGSHPKMWAFMAKVGKALAEPGFHGERGERRKSAAEVLYPDMNR